MKKRILSGIQPSGKLHLGNYFGAVLNWKLLQDEFESYFMIADLHALTTVYEDTSNVAEYKKQLVIDLLASGVDPKKASLFYQSNVSAHSECHLIFSMFTPLSWLERVPTYKEKKEEVSGKDLNTYGFLGYPVLQAADILLYEADFVPVGKDQLPHLELTREIARRYNHLFGGDLKEPMSKLTNAPLLPGLDGRKMSKSYHNAVFLSDDPKTVQDKIMKMMTDPARKLRTDPGNADICPVFAYHGLLNTPGRCVEIKKDCASAKIGCVDCKKEMLTHLQKQLSPIYEARQVWVKKDAEIADILKAGEKVARGVAEATLAKIKKQIKL
jgi:tryptophanyl-tRNA synthetase